MTLPRSTGPSSKARDSCAGFSAVVDGWRVAVLPDVLGAAPAPTAPGRHRLRLRDRIFVSTSAPPLGAEVDTIFQAAPYSAGDSPEYPVCRVRPSRISVISLSDFLHGPLRAAGWCVITATEPTPGGGPAADRLARQARRRPREHEPRQHVRLERRCLFRPRQGARLLARRCPADRRREPGLLLPRGTGEGLSRYCCPLRAGGRERPGRLKPRGTEYHRGASRRTGS